MRRLSLIAGLLAVVSLLAPLRSVEAAQTVTATMTATLSFWDDAQRIGNPQNPAQRIDLHAPLAPACGGVPCPAPPAQGLVPAGEWSLEPESGTCLVHDSSSATQVKTCNPTGYGGIDRARFLGLTSAGPYCGLSFGGFVLDLGVGGSSRFAATPAALPNYLGNVAYFRVTSQDTPSGVHEGIGSLTVLDAYRVNPVTGATEEGRCGLMAPDFRPSNAYRVQLTLTWFDPI